MRVASRCWRATDQAGRGFHTLLPETGNESAGGDRDTGKRPERLDSLPAGVSAISGKQLRALGAGMAAYDPYVPASMLEERGFECVKSLEELMRRSDIVSLHAGAGKR